MGARFGENSPDGYTLLDVPLPAQSLIHVHGSDAELGKVYQPALGIHADPGAFAIALAATGAVQGPWTDWRAAGRNDYAAPTGRAISRSGPTSTSVSGRTSACSPRNRARWAMACPQPSRPKWPPRTAR